MSAEEKFGEAGMSMCKHVSRGTGVLVQKFAFACV